MSRPIFPVELLYAFVDWVSSSGDIQTLKALSLTAHCFVPRVQPFLLRHVTFSSSRPRRRGAFLILLKTKPDFALLVKTVTLTGSAVQLKASIGALFKLPHIEKIILLGANHRINEDSFVSQFTSPATWSWSRLNPSIATSLIAVGQHLSQAILENAPQLANLELIRTKCFIHRPVEPSTSVAFGILSYTPSPDNGVVDVLPIYSCFTYYGFIIPGHQPSSEHLQSIQSLVLEFHHDGTNYRDITEDLRHFLLPPLETVPKSAPLETITVVLRDVRLNARSGWRSSGNWDEMGPVFSQLGEAVGKRPIPSKKFRVEMFGFACQTSMVRNALAMLEDKTEIEATIQENWCV
ncbi:hypothetical protein DL96DRAFT_1685677 [Flagelloscypha sp. PMI_526]|nr:hypothetical protein DL96DRAFT_1685677 [Flagelloscypha sp. PMI_526]